jgi:hypothetical protein
LHESVEKTPQLYSLFSYREADSLSFIVCPRDFQYSLYRIKVSISDNKKLPDRLLVDDVIKMLIVSPIKAAVQAIQGNLYERYLRLYTF